jgi:hypothetical protein
MGMMLSAVRTFVAGAVLVAAPAWGQTASGKLQLELNAAQTTDKGCRLVFVIKNDLGKSLTRAGVEIALFNEAGVVDRLSVLEFKDLVAGKTKVSRFELSGVQCSNISRLLVNGTTACEGEGVEPQTCQGALALSSKAGIEFGI